MSTATKQRTAPLADNPCGRTVILLDLIAAKNRERDAAYASGYDAGIFDGLDFGHRQVRETCTCSPSGPGGDAP
jgi:hypothetical protein